jgi:CHAT domain-containing protein/Tfp pilus assembly protein PilF
LQGVEQACHITRLFLLIFRGLMRATARAPLVAIVLLTATDVAGQTPPSALEARAERLVSTTKAGQERAVACGELDAAIGKSFIDLGETARAAAEFDRAFIAFRLAERAARCAESDPLIGAALNGVSEVMMRRGDLDTALAAATESIRIHERLKDDAGLAQAWNNVANVNWTRGDVHGALDPARRALDLWTAAGDRRGQARALNNIGNMNRALGDFDTAYEYQARALRAFEELADRRSAGIVTDNIGVTYFWRGEYATALEYCRRAFEIQRDVGYQYGAAKSLDSLGNIYRALGAYRLALQSFQQALAIRVAVGEKAGVMETTHNIGLVHFSQGDYELAIDAFKRGLRFNAVLRDQSFAAEALRNIGAAAWRLGQRERATANFRESLAIARREGFRTHEGELLHDLGQVALAGRRRKEASQFFDSSLEIRRSIGDQAGITETLTSLASMQLAERRLDAALDLSQRAIDNALAHDQPELVWEAQTVLGATYSALHRAADARRTLSEAIRSIEQLSAQITGSENLRQHFFETKLSPYHQLIALLVDQRSFGEALELAERSKARVLAQLLRGNRADDTAILSDDEQRKRSRLRDAVFTLNRQIESEQQSKSPDQSRLNSLASARRAAREELAAFDAALDARHPELGAVRGEVRSLSMEDANRLLTDRATAIIEYVVADRRLYAFVLTTDGTRTAVDGRALDVGAVELAARAERFRDRVSTRDFAATEDARHLYEVLLEPIRQRIAGKSRIIVVPDGALWNVPFQALLGPDGYVIEAAAVSYAPSITVLREIQRLPRPSGARTLLAVGKSQFGPVSSSSALEALPEAEIQVRLIRDIYGPDRSVTYLGSDATESQFKAAAPRYSVLHLATHGVLDETSPMYSHLVLSPGRDSPDDDGRLEAWEIMRLKLSADVVVLAACDTGRGRIAPGEGVIGMMWALFAAGARSMVVSQFRVESKSATAVLVGFHRQLAAKRGAKATQLREASLALLRIPRYAHPYYWAGFILVGDPD